MTESQDIGRSRMKLIALILIAFVPMLIAYLAYFYLPMLAPEGSTNQGELINPPLDGFAVSETLDSLDAWVLIQPAGLDCDADCDQLLYLSRQVVSGLGKDTTRVKRALLAPNGVSETFSAMLTSKHADLTVIEADPATLLDVSQERPLLLLMDPNGNVMMFYTLETAGKPMLKDLKHLLRLSNIG